MPGVGSGAAGWTWTEAGGVSDEKESALKLQEKSW